MVEELEAVVGLELALLEELGYVGESAGEAFADGDTVGRCWLVAALPGGLEGAGQEEGEEQEEEPDHALGIDGFAVHLYGGVGEKEPADEAALDGAA